MSVISAKRQRILDFIADFVEEKGYPPSVRDVAEGCGFSSPSIAQYHLNVLEREGHIHRDREISRGIGLARKRVGVAVVPVLGTIAAGEPIPVPSDDAWVGLPEEGLEVPAEIIRGLDRLFALRVKGTSMIDALIDDGDMVLMQQVSTAGDGEMVAVWLKNEQTVTLKRIYRETGRIRLQPANQTMAPLYVRPDELEIQGKVVAVLRTLV